MRRLNGRRDRQDAAIRGAPSWPIAVKPRPLIMMRDDVERGMNRRRLTEIGKRIAGCQNSEQRHRREQEAGPDRALIAAPGMRAKPHRSHPTVIDDYTGHLVTP